jgi:hypothetical protein
MLGAHLRLLLVRTQFSFVARRSVVAHTNTYLICWRYVDQLAHVYSNTPVHLYQNFQILLLISIKLFKKIVRFLSETKSLKQIIDNRLLLKTGWY